MGQLLSYSIQSGILLLAMYLIYKWVLANENQYRFNRIVLLCIYAIALSTFPVINLLSSSKPLALPAISSGTINIAVNNVQPDHSSTFMWQAVLLAYIAGMTFVALRTLLTIGKLCSIIRSGEHRKHNDYILVLTDKKGISPFSWMRFIVMSREDYETSGELILAHECQHIRCHHWADLLIAQLVIIFGWFNPATWLLREELKSVHEYEADKCVLLCGANAREYQMLLIKKAVGARFPSLANSLNHSKLKKRITMMNNQTTSAKRRMRVLAIAPAIALAVLATDIPCVAQTLSAAASTTLASENNDKGTKKSLDNLNIRTLKAGDIDTIRVKVSGDKRATVVPGDNGDYIYKVDGKVVDNIEGIDASDIASININKQGEKPVIEVVTKGKANDYIYKVNGQVVDNIVDIDAAYIAQMNISKEGEKTVVEVVTKDNIQCTQTVNNIETTNN